MAWGGALNSKGTDYLRLVREMDKVIEILEKLKSKVGNEQINNINKTIEIIMEYMSKISKGK
ncbi:MAG: hypothetical protein ACFFAS_04760 [Promethearchaeota archaeon]